MKKFDLVLIVCLLFGVTLNVVALITHGEDENPLLKFAPAWTFSWTVVALVYVALRRARRKNADTPAQ